MKQLLAVVTCCALGACGGDDDPSIGPDASDDGDAGSGEPVVPGADPTFGGDGLVTHGFRGGLAGVMRVCRQDDGKVVGVGGTQESILIMRVDGTGAFDPGFGGDGVVELPWGLATNGVQVGYGCVIDDEGRIVIASRILALYQGLAASGVVARLDPDGELDTSFAGTGYVLAAPGAPLIAAALQPDGKIVAGGYGRLERFLEDGSHDPDFGTDGVATVAGQNIIDLVVQADGHIVSVGGRGIARYTATGAFDTGFGGGDGIALAPGTAGSDALWGVTLDGDGLIVVGGAMTPSGGGMQALWLGRYDDTGTLDASFGGADGVWSDAGTSGLAYGVGVDSGGRVVASGYASIGGNIGRSARFEPDGDPDLTFGAGGAGALFQDVLFSNVVFEPDGSFTVGGAGFGETTTFAPVFARTAADGNGAAGFGAGGEVKRDIGGSFDRANAIAFQPDGKVLIAGWANGAGGGGIVRLEPDGSLDASFGDGGQILDSGALSSINSIAVHGDRILVSGLSGFSGDVRQLAVVAYDLSGQPDTSYGVDGVAALEAVPGLDASGLTMAIDADGSTAVVGQTNTASSGIQYAVVRFTADGDPDTGFGTGGAAISAFTAGGVHVASHAVIQDDGAVVVLGQSGNSPTLIRFDAGGTIDAGFGTVVPPDATGMLPFGLLEQADGKLVVVAGNYMTGAMLVARYDADGAPDAGFGDAGVVTRSFAGNDFYGLYAFMGVLELSDGKLLVGLASAVGDGLREDGVLLRLEADGAADESYGPDGVVALAIGSGSTSVNALALDGEGRLVAAGRTWTRSGGSDYMALRFQ